MINAIKAEFRKLYTVRSTYVIFAICLLITVFFAFYIEGFKATDFATNPGKLASEVTSAVNTLAVFGALVGLLLVTHEYRYNTIMYTITASKSRTRVFLAKLVVISVFAVVFTLAFAVLSPVLTSLAISIRGVELIPQVYDVGSLLWRALFVGWGTAMAAFIIAMLIRSQVGAIAALLLIPPTAEQLLSLLLKENAVYLPFMSLTNVLLPGAVSASKSALVFLCYLVPSLLITWVLFLRRDAN
jgi:ABC-type transport system involved in multi-copper enzyme maturation permease subunit